MRAVLSSLFACAAISACTLPDFEVSQNALEPGTGGTSDDGMSGSAGAAGSAGTGTASNNGGSDSSDDTPDAPLAGSGGAAGAGGSSSPPLDSNDAGSSGGEPEPDNEAICIDYCTDFFRFCEDNPANDYDSDSDCVDVCRTSDWPIGDSLEAPGSIRCRLTHSGFAEDNPGVHCMHAARVPAPSCPP
jgi:hypothetical protein